MGRKLKPKVGEIYTDCEGRKLIVDEVRLNDRLGREVIGRIWNLVSPNTGRRMRTRISYATTLEQWRETWRDKREPIPVGRMKIG